MKEPWPLPSDWQWAEWNSVARVESNLVDPTDHPDLPHIAPNHIESGSGKLLPYQTVREDGVISSKHLFEPGHLLYSKIRPYLAKAVTVDFSGLCSADMYPVATELDTRYLKWWMLSSDFTRFAAGEQARTVLPKINKNALGRLPVPVPPIAEQHRIADLLEDHLSRLDAADAYLNTSEAKLRALLERLVLSTVTGADAAERHPAELASVGTSDGVLGPLPVGWAWARLGEIADVVGGVTKDAKKQNDPSYVEVPYLRVANVQRGYLKLDQITTIRVDPAKAKSLTLEPGDVLLNEGGDRDKLARGWVWQGEVPDCIHQNHVFRARIREPLIDPYFLSWTTNTLGGRWAERNGKQSVNLASISLSMIKKMPVIVPANGEASLRMRALSDQLQSLDRLTSALAAARARRTGLRRSLLAAAFSGSLTGAMLDSSDDNERIPA